MPRRAFGHAARVHEDERGAVLFDQLREASAERGLRPPDDKRLTQARRAVEKAVHLLRWGSGTDE